MVMRRSEERILVASSALGLLTLLAVVACGSSDSQPSPAMGGTGGASDGPADGGEVADDAIGGGGSTSASDPTVPDEVEESGGAPNETDTVGGAGGAGGAGGTGGAGGAGNEPAAGSDGGEAGSGGATVDPCSSATRDLPDDDFVDANCDGIDGERDRGIFVSPSGEDSAPGTIDAPVLTLSRAIELATSGNVPVYVCNGSYRESVAIRAPVSIFGGYDCSRDWLRIKDHAVVESGAGLALSIQSVQGPVLIERVAFRALPGNTPGQSSQAAGIIDSPSVTLVRVELEARAGAPGAPGQPGARVSEQTALRFAAAGADSTDCVVSASPGPGCDALTPGGFDPEAVTTCAVDGLTYRLRGGRGGAGANPWLSSGRPSCVRGGTDVHPGEPGEIAIGNDVWQSVGAFSGQIGADGTDGEPASSGVGSLSGFVYQASNRGGDGKDGLPGFPGAGGPGGFGSAPGGDLCYITFKTGAGGGQGGAGGCGGGRALGGGAGGGSIALVMVNSRVELRWPRIVTDHGGRGGDGELGAMAPEIVDANGQPVRPPGAGGRTTESNQGFAGTPGGRGGRGGRGGDGGPGGGGPSIGVLYVGEAPRVSDATYSLGLPGDGGEAQSVRSAANGVTGETYEFTP